MATVYKNKYPVRCVVSGRWMEKGEGWVVPTKEGTWRAICDEVATQEGHARHGGDLPGDQKSAKSAAKGITTGKSTADCWVEVFEQNEDKNNDRKCQPWTDQQISEFMMHEFPNSSVQSKEVRRVRMYRSSYNKGAHSFAGRSVPKKPSYEYNDKGDRVNQPVRKFGGMTEDRCRQIAKEESACAAVAVLHQVQLDNKRPVVQIHFSADKKSKNVDSRGKHVRFVDVLKRIEARVPVMLVGAAGCGKTFLAEQCASALGLGFSFNSMSEGVSESHLLGRMVPDAKGAWSYRPSPFVNAYEHGGVHLLDEIDAADPNLLVAINAALANGYLSLPFAQLKPLKQHEDSIIIAAANTFGTGANRQYVGRNQLDAATMDRFKMGMIEMDYDRNIERAVVTALLGTDGIVEDLLKWAWGTREAIDVVKMRRIMSSRNIIDGAKMLKVGTSFGDVKAAYFTGWSDDEKVRISGRQP